MATGKGFNKKYELSEELSDFMGEDKSTRANVMKKVWVYIKRHKLQDDVKKRIIHPDETLSTIIGSKSIDMFQMAKKLNPHFIG